MYLLIIGSDDCDMRFAYATVTRAPLYSGPPTCMISFSSLILKSC